MDIQIREATARDVPIIEEMLLEAARWVDALGVVMWEEGELDSARIAREIAARQFFIADANLPPELACVGGTGNALPGGSGGFSSDTVRQGPPTQASWRIEPAGAIRFQLVDLLFWPDLAQEDSAFVHRLVVRRAFKGTGVSTSLLDWSVARARSLGKRFLRLDCDAQRARLRAFYEQFGFRLHSYRQVGSYYVARYELPLDEREPTRGG